MQVQRKRGRRRQFGHCDLAHVLPVGLHWHAVLGVAAHLLRDGVDEDRRLNVTFACIGLLGPLDAENGIPEHVHLDRDVLGDHDPPFGFHFCRIAHQRQF